jgi:two-component system, LuxR family, response regulator FixJ
MAPMMCRNRILLVINNDSSVAVVDDDPAVLNSLKFLISIAGYGVVTYASALAYLEDQISQASCMILDQHMPQMTGLELAAHLRAEGKQIPILLITGAVSPSIISRAAELGIEKVLDKPPTEGELLGFIEAYNRA